MRGFTLQRDLASRSRMSSVVASLVLLTLLGGVLGGFADNGEADGVSEDSRVLVTARTLAKCSLDEPLQPGEHPPGCWRPYGPRSPFNAVVPGNPTVRQDSAEIIKKMMSLGLIADMKIAPETASDWYHPLYFSSEDDPEYVIRCTNSVRWGPCEVEGMTVRIPAEARPASGGDAHLAVVEQHTGWEYDFWQASDRSPSGGVLRVTYGGRTRINGNGVGSDATAAHFGLAGGIVRFEELRDGSINHALFLFVGCSAEEEVLPALGNGRVCDDPTDAPAVGARLWLDMSRAEILALGLPEWKQALLIAMSVYGGYVGDTGGNEAFTIALESASSYTSFGQPNPWVHFVGESGVLEEDGVITFDIAEGVDWAGRLRVLEPVRAPCLGTRVGGPFCDYRTPSPPPDTRDAGP